MMKTSISSDVWEKKKALISRLYMEEEWPLKQVIKQIRTDDFNPSETQLRSRLKKWRVTKPSRQTRKKSLAEVSGEEDSDVKRKASIQRPLPSLPVRAEPIIRHEWPMAQPIYGQSSTQHHVPDQDRKWSSPMIQQLTPSPSGEHILVPDRTAVSYPDLSPTTTAFDHTSPVGEGLMLNTTSAMTPSYQAYPLSPESCLPSPGTATTPGIGWPPRAVSVDYGLNPSQWYSLPFEAITPPATVPQSTAAPMAPSVNGYLPQGHLYSPQYHQYPSEAPEYPPGYDVKNWKRAMSLQYDMAGHLAARPEHDRKQMIPHTQPHGQMHTMTSPTHTQPGPHSVMCAPMPYVDHDHYAQKPPGIGY
ncbi:uncharacterized protein PGRI_092970 [Penicillium griseofulvum]|uniref:Clr5 domain-containing protein n=1 Tax=Penicillium patulum TaxID=5078 RepID=A0A135LSF2_PENPA|nr:uncharacterized protein PGRI_092970 [Penicillium griseofulvum]KXG51904.1 hypothetical protein PGRI_092970 [Penicillium griseofulvum]